MDKSSFSRKAAEKNHLLFCQVAFLVSVTLSEAEG